MLLYRKMYEENIKKSEKYDLHEKILYHPDLTLSDQNFINDKLRNSDYNIIIT